MLLLRWRRPVPSRSPRSDAPPPIEVAGSNGAVCGVAVAVPQHPDMACQLMQPAATEASGPEAGTTAPAGDAAAADAFAAHPSAKVRAAVAADKLTTPETLTRFAQDDSALVREAVAACMSDRPSWPSV